MIENILSHKDNLPDTIDRKVDKMTKIAIMISFILICFSISVFNVDASDDVVSLIEQQRIELEKKDESIKKEMARLKTLRDEINQDIEKYTNLLKQIDKSLEKAQETGNKRLKHVAKAYEAMQPEDAATRLSGLDRKTAVQILLKMNSKKAGMVIGNMEAKKATTLTMDIAKLKK
jgi:flagellar motility protein MotE (MotC chaperone)